jgi:hypothetical protein
MIDGPIVPILGGPMNTVRHRVASAALLSLVVALTACGTDVAPSATAPMPTVAPPTPSVAPSPRGPLARDAYRAAICPVLLTILDVDPRLSALRTAGSEGGDVSAHADEIDEVNAELLGALTDLEGVPNWGPGQQLRFHLIQSLHAIRTQLLVVARDPEADTAAAALAAVPFGANQSVEDAMALAVTNGLQCPERTE